MFVRACESLNDDCVSFDIVDTKALKKEKNIQIDWKTESRYV